jgi:FK506-binding protein 2
MNIDFPFANRDYLCCRWDQGLLDMCVGEKRKLTIPPELAYGNRPVGPIPAGSTLVFETELVEIVGGPKDEL